ncbi:electron transfer flavoprotein subunit alpha/FixB family protein [Paenibacillus piscarius]|uniref:electron transfer flavoprotein subunit alpha/FixB family protein n=1 Tax=Paenibacillus piscarius TaxID=1089681 RepID=UPI001EE7A8E0|nr:electron transfer flavoprotein subunit alpha/FixB family protein [Paenibacillus piscarius]
MPIQRVRAGEYEGIMIACEYTDGILNPVVYELLGCAVDLNRTLRTDIAVVLTGPGAGAYAASCISYGADIVYVIDQPAGSPLNEEVHTELLHQLVLDIRPEILLFPSTIHSKSIAARLAARLHTGLTADCTGLNIDPAQRMLLQIRPAREGTLMATVCCPEARPQMATIRPGTMLPPATDPYRKGRIIHPQLTLPAVLRTSVLEVIGGRKDYGSSASSGVVVAAGRGVCSKEGIELVRELASCLGAELGATRPVIDQGWLDYSHQIGLTGKNVSGRIYIAVGLSGAVQHTVGIRRMDTVIAFNRDRSAPILKLAAHGIVADLFEALPLLITQVRQNMKVSR